MTSIFTALLSTVLLFGNGFILLGNPRNFVLYPTLSDYGRLFLLFAICFISLTTFLEMVIRKRMPHRYRQISFAVIICSFYNLTDFIIFTLFPATTFVKIVSVFVGLLYLPISLWVGIRFGSASVIQNSHVVLLPLALVVLYYGIPRVVFPASINRPYRVGSKGAVHLIIYDGLSWDVLFKNQEVDPAFPNFREVARGAYVCTNAYPNGRSTERSLGRLITGRRYDEVTVDKHGLVVASMGGSNSLRPIPVEDTIFKSATVAGYNNVLVGYHLPYLMSFGTVLTQGVPVLGKEPIYARMLQRAPRLLFFPPYLYSDKSFTAAFRYYIDRVMESPPNTFFYVHLNQPHVPYPYSRDGKRMKRIEYYRYLVFRNEKEYYLNSVFNLDRHLGELIAALKKKGEYDKSLLIITSDHNYLDYKSPYVPFLIKAPYQRESIRCGESMDMIHFKSFIDSYFHTGKVDVGILKDQPN